MNLSTKIFGWLSIFIGVISAGNSALDHEWAYAAVSLAIGMVFAALIWFPKINP